MNEKAIEKLTNEFVEKIVNEFGYYVFDKDYMKMYIIEAIENSIQ